MSQPQQPFNMYIGPETYQPPPAPVKQLNWFFVVLAGLSALPTAFFGYAAWNGESVITICFFLWCAMWTAVWWSLRYR